MPEAPPSGVREKVSGKSRVFLGRPGGYSGWAVERSSGFSVLAEWFSGFSRISE